MQSKAPRPIPCTLVNVELTAEHLSSLGTEYRPRRDNISSRITHSRAAKIDDRGEPAGLDENVRPEQVGVYPHC